ATLKQESIKTERTDPEPLSNSQAKPNQLKTN
ncbi:MAG: hypothetical protein RLZZ171_811, partial [Cyanobacteriota bacterium]